MKSRPSSSRGLFARRAEAFVLDAVIAPIALGSIVFTVAAGVAYLWGFKQPAPTVILIAALVLVAWCVVTEATQGASGGKGAVGLRIARGADSHSSAFLVRACVKWLPPIMFNSAFLAAERWGWISSNLSEMLRFFSIAWLILLTGNASQSRGWLDRMCGTFVTDQPRVGSSARGFEVEVLQSPLPIEGESKPPTSTPAP